MKKQIVIIGGMGPQASIELHRRLISRAAALGARNGADFPEVTHISLPIDDFINDESKTAQALDMISVAMKRLYLWRKYAASYRLQYGTFARA